MKWNYLLKVSKSWKQILKFSFEPITKKNIFVFMTQSDLQPHYGNGAFGNDYILALDKGQLILKWVFEVVNFLQKTNENNSHSSKNEFIRSFFGGNR